MATQGEVEKALAAAAEAIEASSLAGTAFARRKAVVYALATRASALRNLRVSDADEGLANLQQEGEDSEFLFLASCYIPYLYSVGQHRHAKPVTRAMRLQADLGNHRWRQADVLVFSAAEAVRRGLSLGEEP